MASQCANCGAESKRRSVTFDEKGDVLRERCASCDPEYFAEPFRDPTDNRIYSGPEAMPHLYKRDRNDVYQAKDELLADTAALWDDGPTERAIRRKQKIRRTEPMTPEEIEAGKQWGNRVLADAVRKGGTEAAIPLLGR